MGRTRLKEGEPVIVKKYANRRLYDTERSTYVTLDDLCDMVKEDRVFNVLEAQTDKDITRSILTQILLEQDAQGKNLMPVPFLRNLIKFYDDGLAGVASKYLETTFDFFVRNQNALRSQLNKSVDGVNQNLPQVLSTTSSVLEEIQRRNAELFERAVDLIRSFRAQDGKYLTNGHDASSSEDTHNDEISDQDEAEEAGGVTSPTDKSAPETSHLT